MKRGLMLIVLMSIAGIASLWLLLMRFESPSDEQIVSSASAPVPPSALAASTRSGFATEGILESDSPADRQIGVAGNDGAIREASSLKEPFSVKYAKSTDIEILSAHKQRRKEMMAVINEYLAGEIQAGRYETIEAPIDQQFVPTDKRESVRVEATPDPARGITTYKVARCDSATLPESAQLHLEIVWLGQEIESRGLKEQ